MFPICNFFVSLFLLSKPTNCHCKRRDVFDADSCIPVICVLCCHCCVEIQQYCSRRNKTKGISIVLLIPSIFLVGMNNFGFCPSWFKPSKMEVLFLSKVWTTVLASLGSNYIKKISWAPFGVQILIGKYVFLAAEASRQRSLRNSVLLHFRQ